MITKITVEGYKSIKNRLDLELKPLTVLSGANSSGKSSAIQPILLLKQTYEASYDPGPFLLSGPNIAFSEAQQMFWRGTRDDAAELMRIGFATTLGKSSYGVEIALSLESQDGAPVRIKSCRWQQNDREYVLTDSMSEEDIVAIVPDSLRELADLVRRDLPEQFRHETVGPPEYEVYRARSVLSVQLRLLYPTERVSVLISSAEGLFPFMPIEPIVRRFIHVPGLRGQPRRTYPVTSVSSEFPGVFTDYAASVIASWHRDDKAKLDQLGADLRELGLTWKVASRRVGDIEVEILVGRMRASRRGGARDLVSIADVGFGVVQVLPVAVALLVAGRNHCVYLEQPEIHLHPKAQASLANLIARSVSRGTQVIVETHSELLLLGIQRLVAENKIPSEDVALYWFERDRSGATKVKKGEMNGRGQYGDWPVDFAETSMSESLRYMKASLRGKEV